MREHPPAYVIITPAHNEARFLPAVIEAVARQTVKPLQWIIVNDRSTDQTAELLHAAARRHGFIQPLHLTGPGPAALGAHVAHVVMTGLKQVRAPFDYLVKMDADVLLPEDYFARLFGLFDADPRLGIAAGKMYTPYKNQWIEERYPDFHVPGLCKTYRARCFAQIGGFIPLYGWDILDCTKARMLGWTTRSSHALKIRHLRMTGSRRGMLRGHIGHGRGMWATNAHPLFVVARALYRSLEAPYLTGLCIMLGWLLAWRRQEPRLQDRRLVRFMRREQLGRLVGGKLGQESLRVRKLGRRDRQREGA